MADLCLLRRTLRPAQQRFYSGDQLHHAKRLRDIVIRSEIQSLDLVQLTGLCGDHNDRNGCRIFIRPELSQNLQTVFIRKHDV